MTYRAGADFDEVIDQALISLMAEISQRRWYAGWMIGIEFALWRQMKSGNVEYSMMGDTNDSEELTPALFALATAVQRWPMWDESQPEGEQDATVVSFEEFERIFAERG